MVFLNKLVLIWSLLAVVIRSKSTGLIEFKNVRAGATVNRLQRNETSIEVLDSIFNRNSSYPEIYRNFTEFIQYPPKWRSRQFNCLESIDSVSHPSVKNNNKFSSNNAVDRSFLQLEEDLFKREKLNVDNKYKNGNYTCLFYEICNLKEERIRGNVKVIDEDVIRNMGDNQFMYFDRPKAVFRVKKGIETDYVDSITKGTCLAQIYVYEKDSIKEQLLGSYFDKKLAYKSPLVSATNNIKLENWVNDFLIKTQSLLYNFENFSVKNQSEIFKRMESDAIRDFRLISLPTLGEKLVKFTPTPKKLDKLRPGYTLNLKELKDDTVSFISTLYVAAFVENLPSESDEYFGMINGMRNNGEKIESSCPFKRLAVRSSDHVNDHQDLEFFDCFLEKKQFGIAKYLKKEYKRKEIRVCRTVTKETLEGPLNIINWHNDYQDIGYNVFMDEVIVIKYPKEGETHYVSAVVKGDCLYQAFVYNAGDNIDTAEPLFTSELISGSEDIKFTDKISKLLLNTATPKDGLYQVLTNETLKSEVTKQFKDNYVLSINLRSMRAERPLPQVDLLKYYLNFGNSLQASLVTIFMTMIAAKLLIN